jgi:serine/threonine-protein kinase
MSSAIDDTLPASEPGTSGAPGSPAQISRFEIQRKLGEGGNGVVWLAHDPLLDRKVAIKVLRSDDNTDAAQRLLREAQSAAKLVHENIIVVHDVGMQERRAYVAMEYVAGMPLGR